MRAAAEAGAEDEGEAARRGVAAFGKTHGPFFALLGFGQGASLAACLTARGVSRGRS